MALEGRLYSDVLRGRDIQRRDEEITYFRGEEGRIRKRDSGRSRRPALQDREGMFLGKPLEDWIDLGKLDAAGHLARGADAEDRLYSRRTAGNDAQAPVGAMVVTEAFRKRGSPR